MALGGSLDTNSGVSESKTYNNLKPFGLPWPVTGAARDSIERLGHAEVFALGNCANASLHGEHDWPSPVFSLCAAAGTVTHTHTHMHDETATRRRP